MASNYLTDEYIDENKNNIFGNDALLIEGYFVKENFNICRRLCEQFQKENKFIILAIRSILFIQNEYAEILEISQYANLIFWSIDEIKVFVGKSMD